MDRGDTHSSEPNILIFWLAFGPSFVREAAESVASATGINADTCVITDAETAEAEALGAIFEHVVVADFRLPLGHLRKAEMWQWLPDGYDVYLYLDCDTRVIGDIALGFEKALEYELAMVPAPDYCLDHFWGFGKVMEREGVPQRGQLLYNSGVIFFTRTKSVGALFARWLELAERYGGAFDQAYLTLAMEMLRVRPYALSPNYNYLGMGLPISGDVRVWHSRREVPKGLNDNPKWWPMRSFEDGRFKRPGLFAHVSKDLMLRLIGRRRR